MISNCEKYITIMILAAVSYCVFIKPIMYEKTKKKKTKKEEIKKISGGKIFGGNIVKELIDYNNMANPIEQIRNIPNTSKIEDIIAGITDINENKPEEAKELNDAGITKTIRDNIQERLEEELNRRLSNSDNTNTTVQTPDNVMPDQTINSQPETPDNVLPDQTIGPQPETPDNVMPDQTMDPPPPPESSLEPYTETLEEPTVEQPIEQPLEQPLEQLVEQPVETAVEQLSDPITEPIKNRDVYNDNDIKMKNIEDLNSAQDIQISNIQEKITLMEQNMKNIEEQNNNNNIEDKMKQSLNELKNLNASSKRDIEMNKKNIDVNNKNVKRINQINKNIEELYKQTNVTAEEDDIMVGGNNNIKRKVEQIFKTSMNGGKKEKNTQELAVDIFDNQVPLENNKNNYGAFEKNKFFEY